MARESGAVDADPQNSRSARVLTRAGSHNVRLAALAAKELTLLDVDVTRISLADYPLPLYEADLDARTGQPANALTLKQMIMAHQGIFIASPEYSAIGNAHSEKCHRLGIARARARPSDLCRLQGARIRDRFGISWARGRIALADGFAPVFSSSDAAHW